ncbi:MULTISPECIES: lipopolysaccharide biosynthesis protein [Methanobacterium]|uniref:Polysaccharide biosynthesis protein n=1 Tax=Methanobacterium bryantii TaxID=2161 RepID=A0A2A2H3B3_METBR|nr:MULTISPECIES: oligosaccharide flippase family protein [Methanobacterium]OEC86113.1 hypothetical protein A9507_11725 [Methanobacterium sp. A39]PAV03899.1 hypothetical protein ASJ80_02445 [Methanobacterium bryantii]
MNINLDFKIKKFKLYLKDPLYKNSFFLLLSSISNGAIGFVFWIIAAKMYPQEDIGITTALISSMTLIVILSGVGLDQSLIRFFPERDKNSIFNTIILTSIISSIMFAIIFLAGINIWSPKLIIIIEYTPLFILFISANTLSSLIGITFIASRKANFYFLETLLLGSKILLLVPLVFLGYMGLFISFALPFLISTIFLLFLPFKFNMKPLNIDVSFLKESIYFSSGSYITNLLMTTPSQIISLITLNVLGAKLTADYFMAYSISSLLFMIPYSFSSSLFVEGSHGEPLHKKTLKSLLGMFSILIPMVLFFYFFGAFFLEFLGKNYLEGLSLLKILSLSSFFVAVCSTYISLKKIQKDVKSLILLGGLIFVFTIGLSYLFMHIFGLIGIGYAWFTGYGLCTIIILIIIWKNRWI